MKQTEFEQQLVTSYSQLQNLLRQVYQINRQRAVLRQNYIADIVGDIKCGDIVEIHWKEKYFYGTIEKMMVTNFGRKILITLREGKKKQVIAYEVEKDEFLIKKMY